MLKLYNLKTYQNSKVLVVKNYVNTQSWETISKTQCKHYMESNSYTKAYWKCYSLIKKWFYIKLCSIKGKYHFSDIKYLNLIISFDRINSLCGYCKPKQSVYLGTELQIHKLYFKCVLLCVISFKCVELLLLL